MRLVAITGAGGMIGRHLVEALRPAGVGIRALLLPSEQVPASFEGVEIFRGDIRNRHDLSKFFHGADAVFHLAALVGRDANQASFDRAREINVAGTRNVVDVAKQCSVQRLVFLSTCCVYGLYSTADEIIDERTIHAPLNLPYDVTKTEAEQIVAAEDPDALAWSILEIPVALGGEFTTNKPTILSLIRLTRLGFVPCPISGSTWVNYVFGRDVAEAMIALAHHPEAVGQTFIFSESAPVPEFLTWIAGEFGRGVRKVHVPGMALKYAASANHSVVAIANRRRFSAQKIRCRLGFRPSVGLRLGLERTLRHYQIAGLIP